MKKTIIVLFIFSLLIPPSLAKAESNQSMKNRLSGKIMLAVERSGEAYYINPADKVVYYLGGPEQAFAIMRKLSLGVSNKDFNSFNSKAPIRLSGRILIKPEDHGRAFYVDPSDLSLNYLGRPNDAFNIMRSFGIGINSSDLEVLLNSKLNQDSGNRADLVDFNGSFLTQTVYIKDGDVHYVDSYNRDKIIAAAVNDTDPNNDKSYLSAKISPNKKFIAMLFSGFEWLGIEIYNVKTGKIILSEQADKNFYWLKDSKLKVNGSCGMGISCGLYESINSSEPWKMKIASQALQEIKCGFFKDGDSVYTKGLVEEIQLKKDLDGKTIEFVGSTCGYVKDKNNVFYVNPSNQKVTRLNLNPKNFRIIQGNYVTDNEKVFFEDRQLVGANPEFFKVIKYDAFSNNNIFAYAKDNLNVYFQAEKIEKADLSTFVLTDDGYVKDRNGIYENGELKKAPLSNSKIVKKCGIEVKQPSFVKENLKEVKDFSEPVNGVCIIGTSDYRFRIYVYDKTKVSEFNDLNLKLYKNTKDPKYLSDISISPHISTTMNNEKLVQDFVNGISYTGQVYQDIPGSGVYQIVKDNGKSLVYISYALFSHKDKEWKDFFQNNYWSKKDVADYITVFNDYMNATLKKEDVIVKIKELDELVK